MDYSKGGCRPDPEVQTDTRPPAEMTIGEVRDAAWELTSCMEPSLVCRRITYLLMVCYILSGGQWWAERCYAESLSFYLRIKRANHGR